MPPRAESMQTRRKALQHNAFRRSSYLHTQEVTGSSPAVSTKQHLISYEIRCCFRLCLIAAGGFPPGVFTTQNGCMPERSGGAKGLLAICPFLLQNAKEGFSPISLRGDTVALYTKKLIMTTFQEMLAEMPFDKITMSALVKRAEGSPNTFYYHY